MKHTVIFIGNTCFLREVRWQIGSELSRYLQNSFIFEILNEKKGVSLWDLIRDICKEDSPKVQRTLWP